MKFIFVSSLAGDPWGGSEELWSQTAVRLRQEAHEVSASVAWWPQPSPKILELQRRGINLFFRKPVQFSLPVRLWHKVRRRFFTVEEKEEFQWLQRQKPDLIVISQGGTQDGLEWLNFCAAAGLPFVAVVHGNTEGLWPDDGRGGEMVRAYGLARKSFFVSQHNLKLLERQLGEKLPNASVVWNPCNVPAGPPPAWPETNGVWKLACVARMYPADKGQDVLFQVLARDPWPARPLEINLYGTGKCERSLKKMAANLQLKNVHFRGHVNNVKAIWEENHLLLLPSRSEGLPIALVEAMWCARPCVVTDVGGNAELCVDGETGYVAAAPAVRTLAETLERSWNQRDRWQTMGQAARRRAERLIPNDPIGDFCRLLKEQAQAAK